MTTNNNVTSINCKSSQKTSSITLAEVKDALTVWRKSKKIRGEKIPERLWDLIISLLKTSTASESKILSALSIGRPQLEIEKQRRQSITPQVNNSAESIEQLDFCEVTKKQKANYPLTYKPAEAFTTTTSVVELYRKDGALMKIHICTERFDELLRAFFNGCN